MMTPAELKKMAQEIAAKSGKTVEEARAAMRAIAEAMHKTFGKPAA